LADPPTAALVNGVAGHCLDFDPISVAVSGFLGSALTASLTALAEDRDEGYPGADVLTAYILGWEAAAAIARGINPLHYAKGWHPTATLSGFAAAMACSRLLGLNPEQTAMALGVAVSEASGVKTMIGNMTNAFHVGKAARNGIVDAQLAASGFTAHPAALEADQGFLNLFQGPGSYDAGTICDTLGQQWDLTDPGPAFKIYPCCGLVHTGIEAAIALRREHRLSTADIRAVRVMVHEYVPRVMRVREPDHGYAGKFSIPYCIAAALRDGGVTLATFERVDPELVELSRRVEVVVHPDLMGGDTFFAREFTEVQIETDGQTLRRRRQRMDNAGTGCLTDDALMGKLNECLSLAAAPTNATDTFERLAQLDSSRAWGLW
jgi:2-methylcitrate dehydratase PrpD